ncbi:MAG TPA: hypothetical protein VG754_03695 [Verrucomicrobiae bacterium]|nr:hypothetical protein [Verrucomicrobiae bacterium]
MAKTPLLLFSFGAGRLNQFPELRVLLQGLVLIDLQPGAEVKILERMPAQNPMNDQPQIVPLEINPVIPHPEPMQNTTRPLEFAELVHFCVKNLLRQAAKFAEDVKLQFLGHARQLSRACRIKDDLKWEHLNENSGIQREFHNYWKDYQG